MVKEKTLEEAMKIMKEDIIEALGGLPEHEIRCLVFEPEALKKALLNL